MLYNINIYIYIIDEVTTHRHTHTHTHIYAHLILIETLDQANKRKDIEDMNNEISNLPDGYPVFEEDKIFKYIEHL